jgi:hypothetical protein
MQAMQMSAIRLMRRIDVRPIAVYVAGHDQNRAVICAADLSAAVFKAW